MSDVDPELVVARIAERIKKAYTVTRSRVRGAEYTPPAKYEHCWERAAKLCVVYKLHPEEFIEVQFDALQPYPSPNDICNSSAVRRFHENKFIHAESILQAVELQMATLEKLLSLGREPGDFFRDPMQSFDDLFTYIVACEYDLADLKELFFKPAVEQYMTSVHYDTVYNGMLPQALIEAAGKVYNYGDA